MSDPIRSEQEETFEQLCLAVDGGETHEQEAIEFFEENSHEPGFDAAQWLDIALYHAPDVARGIIDFVDAEDRERSDIAQTIADNLDIAYGDDDCQRFEAIIRFALANGVPVDLDVVLDGCNRALDDLEGWANEGTMAPLVHLRETLMALQSGY
ncbi:MULTISPECIES: hypothetical protein [unclassified Paraburkholderia]|jgi:hypothetical protein|uniref:hypothetical protein n=1 Tax=unclassified Paraburkholderia TaxID=2615204 RepID=UPI0019812C08|nr:MULTISPECIES: hypothetical protein [unclassified Paraburkholderia]MBN3857594.1 hypothetical protein [Paraburkholderia sp. Ac-20340]